jgi:hypothetical protein
MGIGNFITSLLFPLWVLTAALGIFFLWKVLSQLFETPVVLFTVLLLLFGTNFFGQIILAGPTASTVLFTLYLAIILLTSTWQKGFHPTPLILMLPVMAAISFLSVPGLFVVLFPLLAWIGDKGPGMRHAEQADPAKGKFRENWWQLLFLAGMVVIGLVLRQFSWFSGTGSFFSSGEGVNTGSPLIPANIHRILFSVKNGWLIYSPLVIFAFAGFYFLAEKNRSLFGAAFLFMLASIDRAAGNQTWWFADRFGYPGLVETYSVLCLPLGYLIQWAWTRNRKTRILFMILSGLLVFLNLFQTWQFSRSILVPGRMTAKYYFAVFGKTAVTDREKKLLEPSCPRLTDSVPAEPWIECHSCFFDDFENPAGDREPFRLKQAAHSGNSGMLLNAQNRFSPGLTLPVRQLAETDSCWIKASAYFFYPCKNSLSKVCLVMTCLRKDLAYKYMVTDLSAGRFHPNRWNLVEMSYLVPFPADQDDQLQVYFMNYGQEECYIDDFEIKLCKPVL